MSALLAAIESEIGCTRTLFKENPQWSGCDLHGHDFLAGDRCPVAHRVTDAVLSMVHIVASVSDL